MTNNQRYLFNIATYVIVAALFFFGGWYFAKNKFKPPQGVNMAEIKQPFIDSIAILQEENANLYAKLSERPDVKKETQIKYRTITKTLYEEVNKFEILPPDEKLNRFSAMLRNLPSFRSDTNYINSF